MRPTLPSNTSIVLERILLELVAVLQLEQLPAGEDGTAGCSGSGHGSGSEKPGTERTGIAESEFVESIAALSLCAWEALPLGALNACMARERGDLPGEVERERSLPRREVRWDIRTTVCTVVTTENLQLASKLT